MNIFRYMGLLMILCTTASAVVAGEWVEGDILSHFKTATGWSVVGGAAAVSEETRLETKPVAEKGPQILNNGTAKSKADYLMTQEEFGDVSVHLEFMVPKMSNAGLYFMGRYEIQILDSYGVEKPRFSDLGGVYQRWDVSGKTKGKDRGFEGVPPLVNAAKAPGEWQSMDVVFLAPRFDEKGVKTANAKFVSVHVNGQLVQENVEVTGPTRAHPLNGEVNVGPLTIQGNHGPIAIRSMVITPFDSASLTKDDSGWIDLFDGKSLSGWVVNEGRGSDADSLPLEDVFKVSDGVIKVYDGAAHGSKQRTANLRTKETFSHFKLQVEYRWLVSKFQPRVEAFRDAGILFHIHSQPDMVWPPSVEMQMGDGKPGDKFVTGDLFVLKSTWADSPSAGRTFKEGAPMIQRGWGDECKIKTATPVYGENPLGEWNRAELIVHGSEKAEFYLNGTLMNKVYNMRFQDKDGSWKALGSGHISVQAEWAELEYRTIRLKKL